MTETETGLAETGLMTRAADAVSVQTGEAAPRVPVVVMATARVAVTVVLAGCAAGAGQVVKVRGGSEVAVEIKAGGDSVEVAIRAETEEVRGKETSAVTALGAEIKETIAAKREVRAKETSAATALGAEIKEAIAAKTGVRARGVSVTIEIGRR